MAHAWVYFSAAVLVTAAAGGAFAYYYGLGSGTPTQTIPLTVQVTGVARGETNFIPAVTVTVDYSSPSGHVTTSAVTNSFGEARFDVPLNTHLTISDGLSGFRTVDAGNSAISVTLYHIAYSS